MCYYERVIWHCGHSSLRKLKNCRHAQMEPSHRCFGPRVITREWRHPWMNCDRCGNDTKYKDDKGGKGGEGGEGVNVGSSSAAFIDEWVRWVIHQGFGWTMMKMGMDRREWRSWVLAQVHEVGIDEVEIDVDCVRIQLDFIFKVLFFFFFPSFLLSSRTEYGIAENL